MLKVSIHCEGCKKKVKKILQNIDGKLKILSMFLLFQLYFSLISLFLVFVHLGLVHFLIISLSSEFPLFFPPFSGTDISKLLALSYLVLVPLPSNFALNSLLAFSVLSHFSAQISYFPQFFSGCS